MKRVFSRQHRWKTLLILLLDIAFIRLGIWQLDRLDQRRAANILVAQRVNAPPLRLNDLPATTDWFDLVNRRVTAEGEFDVDRQIMVQFQTYEGRPGVYLLTPLRLTGSDQAVLVNRGWLPLDQADPTQWAQATAGGVITLTGYLQTAGRPDPGATVAPGSSPFQPEALRLNVPELQAQIAYPTLPVYLLEAPPTPPQTGPPYRLQPNIDLSEGPHLSYALQWFAFAVIFSGGYVYYLRRSLVGRSD